MGNKGQGGIEFDPRALLNVGRDFMIAGTAVGALTLAGCTTGEDVQIGEESPAASADNLSGQLQDAVTMTNAELREFDLSDSNCGGHLERPDRPAGEFSAAFLVPYYNKFPALPEKLLARRDEKMHKVAVDFLAEHAAQNPQFDGAEKLENDKDGRMKKLLAAEFLLPLTPGPDGDSGDYVGTNETCITKHPDGTAEVNPHRVVGPRSTVRIPAGQNVVAYMLSPEDAMTFAGLVAKHPDGSTVVEMRPLHDEKGEVYGVAVIKKFEGCENDTYTLDTTPPTVVTSTPPGMPPISVTIPGRPTTTEKGVTPKHDKHTGPRSSTSVPRDGDHSAGDEWGAGEGASSGDNDPDGYGNGQNRPATPPPASTEATAPPTTEGRGPAETTPPPVVTAPPITFNPGGAPPTTAAQGGHVTG